MMTRMIEIPDYEGPGIYSITDENGKRYIGSSKNIKRRMFAHNTSMARARNESGIGAINKEMDSAIKSGISFHVEILHKFEGGCSFYDLVEAEREYIDYFGGTKNTYNDMVTEDLRKRDYSDLKYWGGINSEKARENLERIKMKIQEREKIILPVRTERDTAQAAAYKRYNATQATIYVRVPPAERDAIQAAAEAAGQSLNAYTRQAIAERMERDKGGDGDT